MLRSILRRTNLLLIGFLLLTACAPAAPAPPAAPAKPAAPGPAATAAPAKAAEPKSAAPAAPSKPAESKPAAAAPAKAAEAKPAAQAAVRKDGPSFTFKFANIAPETDLSATAYKHWAQLVDQRTAGRIKFQFFWGGSLLNATQLFQGIRDGLADFGSPASSYVSGQVPDVASLEVPYNNPTDLQLTLQFIRAVDPVINEIYSSRFGQRVVASQPVSLGVFVACKDKFLGSPEAWNGALVRAAGKWQGLATEAFGAKVVVIDLGDTYTALQRGTADCLLISYNLYESFKFFEVAPQVTRLDMMVNYQSLTVNQGVWDRIPPEDQQILTQAALETQEYIIQQRSTLVTDLLSKWQSQNGVKACAPSQPELARLRGAMQPILDGIAKEQTPLGHRVQEISAEFRDKVERWGPTEGDMTPCPA